MILAPHWRTRAYGTGAVVVALWMAVQIAKEQYFWPLLCTGGLIALGTTYLQSLRLSTVVLGSVLFGYIVGNRGFAQLSLAGNFPLLPGEFTLLIGGAALALHNAVTRTLPFRRDALNYAILTWMIAGTIRLAFDVRAYGVLALRDYALIYYAAFFFLAQWAAADRAAARFLGRCVLVAISLLLIVHPLFDAFPEFFLGTLTVRGVPLIFFKDDLAGNFMAMGSLVFFLQFERTRRFFWILPSLLLAGLMIITGSRSSMVGLAVGTGWLVLAGRRGFAWLLVAGAMATVLMVVLVAQFDNRSVRRSPLWAVYERVISLVDTQGQRTYEVDVLSKGDNNVFRMVWWQAAIDETLETNRWFGLGFGHDLAARFVREYYPESTDDFTVRSPHNVLITNFARMGVVGAALFALIIVAIARRTWATLRRPELLFSAGQWWCAAWILLVSACFGVVLEGPMGATVFWSVLGLASAGSVAETEDAANREAGAHAGAGAGAEETDTSAGAPGALSRIT